MYFKLTNAGKKDLRQLMDVLKREHSTIESNDEDLFDDENFEKSTLGLFDTLFYVMYYEGNPYEIARCARRYRSKQFDIARKNNDTKRENDVRKYVKRCIEFAKGQYETYNKYPL